MPRHAPRPDPFYAIRTIGGAWGIVYRVSFTRHGENITKLFRARGYDNARAALKAARAQRDGMTQSLRPETKQEFSQRLRPSWADPVAASAHRPLKRGATLFRGVDAATDASIWSLPCEQSEVIPVEGVMLKLQIREIGAQLPGGNAESDSERATVPAVPDFWVCSWEALCGGTEGVECSVDGMQTALATHVAPDPIDQAVHTAMGLPGGRLPSFAGDPTDENAPEAERSDAPGREPEACEGTGGPAVP